ncbi:hypothetical protein VIGAN_04093600, partial [Vigna angularis var. angularis]
SNSFSYIFFSLLHIIHKHGDYLLSSFSLSILPRCVRMLRNWFFPFCSYFTVFYLLLCYPIYKGTPLLFDMQYIHFIFT